MCVDPGASDSLPVPSLLALDMPCLETQMPSTQMPSSLTKISFQHSGRSLLFSPELVGNNEALTGVMENNANDGISVEHLSDLDNSVNNPVRYQLHGRLGQGHFGEVWTAVHSPGGQAWTEGHLEEDYILKRLMIERGEEIRLSGLREAYFGELLKKHQDAADAGVVQQGIGDIKLRSSGLEHIVRYMKCMIPFLMTNVYFLLLEQLC